MPSSTARVLLMEAMQNARLHSPSGDTHTLSSMLGPEGPDARDVAYARVCAALRPVLRHFFVDMFPDARRWLAARDQYARSCATACVVGYVLGLGDRHCGNILLDCGTGQVVHIDFGIAFEQGLSLTVPELVPFRLTRDVVDALGPTGTTGAFASTAEVALTALHSARDTVSTVLGVILRDPLYRWNISAMAANLQQQQQHQQQGASARGGSRRVAAAGSAGPAAPAAVGGAVDADVSSALLSLCADEQELQTRHALERVRTKLALHDIMYGVHATDVACAVHQLIDSACDVRKLARMYPGWEPHL
ncbi:hypothetical protein EON66_07500 [archaeon]|nr:MAG: hypothetical protein EON66_07500 [archaeon]